MFKANLATNNPGAVVVEPITHGKRLIATPRFFKKIREICLESNVQFIVDETQTGTGVTGRMWGHEHWNLDVNPCGVIFGRSSHINGFMLSGDYISLGSSVTCNQYIDPVSMINFHNIWKTMQKKKLLELVDDTGSFLKIELKRASSENHNVIQNVRGNGTFLGFDVAEEKIAHNMHKWI